MEVAGADGPAGFEVEGFAVLGALESFGDVADFLVEAKGGGAFGVGGEEKEGGLGHDGGLGTGLLLVIIHLMADRK
ncbi:MAG: hypothetical protein HC860_20860 [Alkalinema sp. RU_4_3]|nr:hypothetical protein [Alkalinema sp. RU_4_3]